MTDYIVVATNTIQSVTDYTTNIVSYITKVREPVISSTQGPQGPPGADGAASTIPGPPGAVTSISVASLLDVDFSAGVPDGALLIYGSADLKWKASIALEKQAFECGQY
mgnify:FL=1|jgi:hypothetical protein